MREDGLTLVEKELALRGDFTKMLPRIRRGNLQREMLVKAARIKNFDGEITVMDCTAGLGEDAFLLAAAGYRVKLYERDPMIAALLQDALERAKAVPELAFVVARMEFHQEDSLLAMTALAAQGAGAAQAGLEEPPTVIYLDPMFPARQKYALVKKKFQVLQQLESPCEEGDALLQAAIACKPRKIVIKRPLKGEYLGDRKPDYALQGKTIRYDCLMIPQST
jgi:16S rRNA (guanine1516-N2)-methyltransferase